MSEEPTRAGSGPTAGQRPVFPILDTLRAVGALAVLTTHASFWAGSYTRHGVWGTLLARLDVGVAIFFVLSGFLLSRPYLLDAAEGRPPSRTGRYFWKRFLRITPVYWVTAAVVLVFLSQRQQRGLSDWVATFLLLDTYVHTELPDGLTQMWSLAVEVAFYLLLPLLMVAIGVTTRRFRPVRVLALIAGMCILTAWWHLAGVHLVDPDRASPGQWLPAYLSWFAVGIAIALVHTLHVLGRWSRLTAPVIAVARGPGVCWAAAAGLLLIAATPIAGPSMLAAPTSSETLVKNVLYAGIGGLLVLSGVFPRSDGIYRRLFENRHARRLGFISYGLFCLHLPILHFVMWQTSWPLFEGRLAGIWVLTMLYSLIAAEIVYRLVEAPAMRLRNWGRRTGSAASTARSEISAR